MGDLPRTAALIASTLLCCTLAALLVRLPRSRPRAEPLWMAGLLAALALDTAVPLRGPAALFPGLVMAWLAGGFAARAAGERVRASWHACAAVPACVLLAALAAGLGATVLVPAFHAVSLLVLACQRAPTLLRAWRSTRSAALVVALAAAACGATASLAARLALPAGTAARAAAAAAVAARLLLAGSLGALVLVQGYPWAGGYSGRASQAGAKGRVLAQAWARLLAAEDALARQGALAASGFLALGAAHEFKNSLALVRAAAEHGLACGDPSAKDESLRLVMEQAGAGSAAAVSFLERLAREGRGEERVLEARAELEGLLRVCRASIRADGIVLRAELADGVRFLGRPGEPARIVLALVENAVQCARAAGGPGGTLHVSARAGDGLATIEVRDEAGGMSPLQAALLFTPGASSTGSTGVGLAIARGLAEQGGGTLSYVPVEGGSCFRLCYPLVRAGPGVA